MDHSCYKCGHSVEDGKPFCGQCGAPQIRVPMPEAAVVARKSGPSLDLPYIVSGFADRSGTLSASALSVGFVWPTAIRACAIAALIAALVMALGLMVPLLAVLGAGSSRR